MCVGVRRAHACGGWGFRRGLRPGVPPRRGSARVGAAQDGLPLREGRARWHPGCGARPCFYAVGVAEAERIAEGGRLRGVLPSLSGEARVSAFVPGYGGARLRLLACAR